MASMTATAVMFTMSRTELSKSVKTGIGRTQVREYQGIDLLTLQASERVLTVAQLVVHGEVHLHLAVDG